MFDLVGSRGVGPYKCFACFYVFTNHATTTSKAPYEGTTQPGCPCQCWCKMALDNMVFDVLTPAISNLWGWANMWIQVWVHQLDFPVSLNDGSNRARGIVKGGN